ncbi:hypothetical protein [Paenibacillus wynnii]|uniref:Uncharacterized protein n=1 Tax=Paenibacillus wynnii TaxID=268407 RepID=A0A098MCK8_9BACL|nr:hypothetical protein [Paenibacillus wynnii]KGE19783.1 hypothetical protein PWYN_10870 [Paenibacillus wynnii]
MRGYNIWRPLMLIAVAFLTNSLVSNVCSLLGMTPDTASNLGILAMIIVALVMYTRMTKPRRRK